MCLINLKKSFKSATTVAMLAWFVAGCNPVTFTTNDHPEPTPDPCAGEKCVVPQSVTGWVTGNWGSCSKPCDGGERTRSISCQNQEGVTVPDDQCLEPKPSFSESCNIEACNQPANWNIGSWSVCSPNCGTCNQTRSVVCQDSQGNTLPENQCAGQKPAVAQTVELAACPQVYGWQIGDWGSCSVSCGGGTKTRSVVCAIPNGPQGTDNDCADQGPKPATSKSCNTQSCNHTYTWIVDPQWGECSKPCGTGIQQRSVTCRRDDDQFVDVSFCSAPAPASVQNCNQMACPPNTVEQTQKIVVPPGMSQLDIMLVIDDSSSMTQDNTKLAQRMSGFINDLKVLNVDWRMCITTTDVDYYQGRPIVWTGVNSHILTKNSPNLQNVFMETIADIGSGYSNDEQAIRAMNLSVMKDTQYNCYRPKAAMAVIIISDEDERSVGGNQALSLAQYKPLIDLNYPMSLVNNVATAYNTGVFYKRLNVNSIIVKDNQCEAIQDAQGTSSFKGLKYKELSNLTAGHVGSICDNDYSNNLKYSKEQIINSMETITLNCVPYVSASKPFNIVVTPPQGKPPIAGLVTTINGKELRFNPLIPQNYVVDLSYYCLQ